MDVHYQIGLIAIIWMVAVVLFQQYSMLAKLPTVGAPLAFVLTLSLNHLGAIVHTDPDYDPMVDLFLLSIIFNADTVLLGFRASLVGLLGFMLGVVLFDVARPQKGLERLQPAGPTRAGRRGAAPVSPAGQLSPLFFEYARLFVAIGLSSYIIPAVIPSFPGSDAAFGALRLPYITGILGLIYWYRMQGRSRAAFKAMVLGAIAPPMVGLLSDAIFGDTLAEAFLIFAYYLGLIRPGYRSVIKSTVLLLLAGYAVFFLSAVWMSARVEVRQVIWGGADFGTRAETMATAFIEATGRTGSDEVQHLLDARLNHNIFIGKVAERFEMGVIEPEDGSTLIEASYAWVPRLFWEDKPTRGGSDFIDTYTGKITPGGVSYGVGAVLEIFVNFKVWGVFFGMLLYGFVLRFLDFKGAFHLRRADMRNALPWLMLTVPCITAFSMFFFLVNELIATAFVALLLKALAPRGVTFLRQLLPRRSAGNARAARMRRTARMRHP